MIESQFREMLDKIDESKDFEVIRSTHETFLANLLSQVWLIKSTHSLIIVFLHLMKKESVTSTCL